MHPQVGLGLVWGLRVTWTLGRTLCGEWGASGFWLLAQLGEKMAGETLA